MSLIKFSILVNRNPTSFFRSQRCLISGPLVPYVVHTCQRGAYQEMDTTAMEAYLNGFTTNTRTQESLQVFNFYSWMMRLYYVRSRKIELYSQMIRSVYAVEKNQKPQVFTTMRYQEVSSIIIWKNVKTLVSWPGLKLWGCFLPWFIWDYCWMHLTRIVQYVSNVIELKRS